MNSTTEIAPLVTSGPLKTVIEGICLRIKEASATFASLEKINHISSPRLQEACSELAYCEGRLFDILYQLFLCYYDQYEKENVAKTLVQRPEQADIILTREECYYESGAAFSGVEAVFNRTMKVKAMHVNRNDSQRYMQKGDFYLYDYKMYLEHFSEVLPLHIMEGIRATRTRFSLAGYLMKNRVC